MTNEQALDMLRRAIDPLQDAVDNVALYMAFEALEKQIPMKPLYRVEESFVHAPRFCPVCQEMVDILTDSYCPYCGQKLDWRDD